MPSTAAFQKDQAIIAPHYSDGSLLLTFKAPLHTALTEYVSIKPFLHVESFSCHNQNLSGDGFPVEWFAQWIIQS